MGPRATGKEAVATVVVDKMRRRMRQNGYHAHITLQARPAARCQGRPQSCGLRRPAKKVGAAGAAASALLAPRAEAGVCISIW